MFKKILLITISTILAISLLSCQNETEETSGQTPENNSGETLREQLPESISDDAPVEQQENIPVAVVNDAEIMLFDLFEVYQNLNRNYMEMGVDISDDGIRDQVLEEALDTLIAYEVLFQSAVKEGYTISPEKLDEEIETIKSQFESEQEFIDSLEMRQITVEELKEDIEREMLVSDYVESTVEQPEVTEEEIMEMYDQYTETLEEDPPEYEDLKPQLEQTVKNNKFSENVDVLIENLKEDNKIEVFREEMD
ncbi:SurA N-terminal domain-containing protein [Herbivorax sp. ANBcel31]|uniref:SurA N-terminal domain-containing protein n=1 Tax=Herbivorax sp. ANBcel31 TaxID=3069754 RepID=UPI0027B2D3E7|nr:SurA N-terminal domain-containing protein [Herbivorax sp. ANBcel31]MDQ2086302.1 SurA N-terminal domain-containing protein [Herbivorax sp. ANBcel31]